MADAQDLRQMFSSQLNKAGGPPIVQHPPVVPQYAQPAAIPQMPVQQIAPQQIAPQQIPVYPAPAPDNQAVSVFDANSFIQKHWLKVLVVVVIVLGLFCAWYVFVYRANRVSAQASDEEQKKAQLWAQYNRQQQLMMAQAARSQQPAPPSGPRPVEQIPGAPPPPPPPADPKQAFARSVHAESEMRATGMQNRPSPVEAVQAQPPPANTGGDPHFTPLPS